MQSNYPHAPFASTADLFAQEKFSADALTAFIKPMQAKRSTRGDLLRLLRTLLTLPTCPRVIAWADLCRMLSRRGASDQVIIEARILWAQFKSSITAASPGPQHRERSYG
jgi:hypothetical protein